ncbi:MAG TPA: glycosyltransferase, partial [Solirubrobacterales bacterium]
MSERIPILYLAPWVGYGGSDKNTIDWFRWIDRERFAPSLITTQASPNPLIHEVVPFAEEVWVLPDLMPAEQMPAFIFDFLASRRIEVIHLMNSRLGFDLLPDLFCLPEPPSVVVQLHVEEVDRSGYVRYVTTRYGNLVDRFSISNEHVAAAVRGYGVPAEKVEVIYTGVDTEEEFSPQSATPAEKLDNGKLQILFGARITDQKDPLLMVDVAAGLRARGVDFRIQVVGDGDLDAQMRAKIAKLELGEEIALHPPTPGLRDWYAATDVMLMTSKFEGIPCALFESMSMGLPIVAPALPGISELLDEEDGLVPVGSPAAPYVEKLAALAADPKGREALGADLRERAGRNFSVQEMAKLHEDIYVELTAGRDRPDRTPPPLPEPLRFIDRPVLDKPLVSVLIPHYNQARFLRECVESVRAQTYAEVEIVVVDDASTEAESAAALDEIAALDRVEVLRLTENGGPSQARNAGLERCGGRYILPVDSDNLLLPDAIERLVAQLNAAGEEIGFIYPNLDFFGNREEYHEATPYNLFTLLHANFCD